MSEPARIDTERASRPNLEVRVGSATNALQPIPGAQRSLAAAPAQWSGLELWRLGTRSSLLPSVTAIVHGQSGR